MSVQLHARQTGSGPPLIILHGLFGSGVNWRSIARRLGRDYQVILLDLRNHGDSPHAAEMDYRTMAGDVVRFIRERRLQRPVVLGHSMGGKVAMVLALEHPDLVGRLIVADIAPRPYPHDYTGLIDAMLSLDLDALATREQADQLLARDIPDSRVRGFLLLNLRQVDGQWRWRINLPVIRQQLPKILDFPDYGPECRYSGPTLFVYGENSDYLDAAGRAAIEQFFPGATVHGIAGAGHWLHAERPGEFLAAIQHFLARRPPRVE